MNKKSKKLQVEDLLINKNPKRFDLKEWLKAAKALQEAVKKEKKKVQQEMLEELEENDTTRFPAY